MEPSAPSPSRAETRFDLDPASLTEADLPHAFRGLDPKAVRVLLQRAAAEIEELRAEVSYLTARSSEAAHIASLPDDPAALDALVGEETARILTTARKAAAEIRAEAEAEAERIVAEATRRAAELEAGIATVHAEAEAEAERIVAEGTRRAAELEAGIATVHAEAAARAETDAEAIRVAARAEAEAIREAARSEGRDMVHEARAVRARMLEDLARRRDALKAETARLQAGRDALVAAYDGVRRTLDELTGRVDLASTEAQIAADAVARRIAEQPPTTIADIEAEISMARDLGRPLDGSAPEPVADVEPAPESEAEEVEPEPEAEEAEAEPVLDIRPEPEPKVAAEPEPGPGAPVPPDPDDGPGEGQAFFESVTILGPVSVIDAGEVPPPEPDEPSVVADEVEEEEPEPDPEPEAEDPDAPPDDVDALFARIRASRAGSVAEAREVLRDVVDAEGASETETDVEPVAEETVAGADAAPLDPDPQVEPLPADATGDGEVWTYRADLLRPIERTAGRSLKRHLADEQNLVLDRLRRLRSSADLLPGEEDQIEHYAAVLLPHLEDAAAAGASSTGAMDTPVDIDEIGVEAAITMVRPFRERFERACADQADDPDELERRIRSIYREQKTQVLTVGAADAVLHAYALGQFEAIPDGSPIRWLVDPEQGPCPDAHDNALAGPVTKGEPFPTGDRCPQAHPGCRCLVAVVD